MVATAYGRFVLVFLLIVAAGCSPGNKPQNAAKTAGMPDASEEFSTQRSTESPYVAGQLPAPGARAVTPLSPAVAPAGGGEIPVTLSEYKIDMPTTIPSGSTTFRIINAGTTEHSFEIQGPALQHRLDTVLKPGESHALTLDLKPGKFKVYCPVGTHSDQGMFVEILVRDDLQRQPSR
jgi:hypothetical protein